jgi:hypothetical protein
MNPTSPSFGSALLLRYAKVVVSLFALTIVMVIVSFVYLDVFERVVPVQNTVVEPPKTVAVTEPRTDFGTTVPDDFPTTIPLEAGVVMNQSYSLDYPGQKQLTAVFLSKKTMKENYTLYADFLKKDQWTITNPYEGKTLSSLYALKGKNEMNITISAGEAGSEVSISVLKK